MKIFCSPRCLPPAWYSRYESTLICSAHHIKNKCNETNHEKCQKNMNTMYDLLVCAVKGPVAADRLITQTDTTLLLTRGSSFCFTQYYNYFFCVFASCYKNLLWHSAAWQVKWSLVVTQLLWSHWTLIVLVWIVWRGKSKWHHWEIIPVSFSCYNI